MPRTIRTAPSINAGSMADIAFLLLIFFLVTTTIDEDKGIRLKLPPWSTDINTIHSSTRNVFTVKLNAHNELLVRGEILPVGLLKDRAIEFITNPDDKPSLASSPRKAIIALQNDRGTSYTDYIAVYDQLKAAYNEIWEQEAQQLYAKGYKALSFAEKKVIRNKFPLVISESEPSNFSEE